MLVEQLEGLELLDLDGLGDVLVVLFDVLHSLRVVLVTLEELCGDVGLYVLQLGVDLLEFVEEGFYFSPAGAVVDSVQSVGLFVNAVKLGELESLTSQQDGTLLAVGELFILGGDHELGRF